MKRILGWAVKGILLAGLLIFVLLLADAFKSRSKAALRVWHTASLSNEFTAGDATPQSTLEDYLDREERLFRELKEKVYDRVEPACSNVTRHRGLPGHRSVCRFGLRCLERRPSTSSHTRIETG